MGHQSISRAECEHLLERDGGGWDGWFLVRKSTKQRRTFVVTLCKKGKLYHNQVIFDPDKLVYQTHPEQGGQAYQSLMELINHHKSGKHGFQEKLAKHCRRG